MASADAFISGRRYAFNTARLSLSIESYLDGLAKCLVKIVRETFRVYDYFAFKHKATAKEKSEAFTLKRNVVGDAKCDMERQMRQLR